MCCLVIGTLGCRTAPLAKPKPSNPFMTDDPNKAWVALQPVQCLSNPWEKDWLKAHKNKGTKYPMRDEVNVMKAFFTKKGFFIHDLRIRPYMHDKPLGRACNSPRGDLLLMLVNREDVSLLMHYGFQSTIPTASEAPQKK